MAYPVHTLGQGLTVESIGKWCGTHQASADAQIDAQIDGLLCETLCEKTSPKCAKMEKIAQNLLEVKICECV